MGDPPYFFGPAEGGKVFEVDGGGSGSGRRNIVYSDGVSIPRVPLSCGFANIVGDMVPGTFVVPTAMDVGEFAVQNF